ncbi:hypothetical protein [Paracoccus methylarcula]|uniref:Uncharacterized protein n=1 Tax=Paracoccus methylarcula TaxID=72022 RepID=A0A3R7SD52_9RHOB|nr:hypothetical protein [Paracoccus methylarcula]RNF35058.1 hypothetical protein A7A09_008830 [Paracoccus methylarcula]
MTRLRQNPRTMALAYRIWANCQIHGWYRTIAEVADALGEPVSTIRTIVKARGWQGRFRAVSPTTLGAYKFTRINLTDETLEAMS